MNLEGDREWQIEGGRVRRARCIFCFIHKHKALFLFIQKYVIQYTFLYSSQHRNINFYGGIKYIKGPAFYRHGEEVGFPAMTMYD